MCYILNFTALLILAIRNIDEIGEESNLIKAIRKIQNSNRKSPKLQRAEQKEELREKWEALFEILWNRISNEAKVLSI